MKKLITFLMLFAVFGGSKMWADETIKTIDFTSWTTEEISDGSTVNDCYFKGAGTTIDTNGLNFSNNMKVSNYYVAIPLSGIRGSITVTITGDNRPRFSYALTSNKTTITEKIDVDRPSSGTTVSFIVSDITESTTWLCLGQTGSGNPIKTVTVTTPNAEVLQSQVINISDLRFTNAVWNPSRSNIAGFNLSFSGWQSNDGNLTLSSGTAMDDNTITVSTNAANSAVKIKQVVLVGVGDKPFKNSTPSSTDTYSTTGQDQIVWRNYTGANTVTISITATDRPSISAIYVYTDVATTWSKNDVTLAFSPESGTANINQTDYSIDGRVIIAGTTEKFRPSSITVAGSTNATLNTYHESTGAVGVNTGSTTGTATITASFDGTSNPFYNTATDGTYSLSVIDPSTKTAALTIDDMRYSKFASSYGLTASDENLDRTLGGFKFKFTNGEGIKFNNGDGILLRKNGDNLGKITITPQKSGEGTITITRVDITTNSAYTSGHVKANNGSSIEINGISSYSFESLTGNDFVLDAVDGSIYITGFTIYYTDPSNVINKTNVTPTINAFNPTSHTITQGDSYTSPTLTTNPKNFDINLSSNNTSVATVTTKSWKSTVSDYTGIVILQDEVGEATITASAASSTYFNEAANQTYTVTVNENKSVTSDKWDFRTLNVKNTIDDDTGWKSSKGWEKSGDYYKNLFTSGDGTSNPANKTAISEYTPVSPSQLQDLKFGRENNSGLGEGQIRLYNSYMEFRNSSIWVDIPSAKAGQSIILTYDYNKSSGTGGFSLTNATVEGTNETAISTGNTETTVTLTATANGSVRLQASTSNVRIYRIQVKDETRGTLDLRDSGSNTYERNMGTGIESSNDNHFNHRVTFTPSDGVANPVTYAEDATHFHITSSDATILDVSKAYIAESNFGNSSSFYFNNIIPRAAGTATLTITFDGNNNYKSNSYTSGVYTVYGSTPFNAENFNVEADNQEIQQGQFSNITPKITDKDGNLIGIKQMVDGSGRYTTYTLGEDEDEPDYNDFFDFTYTAAESGTGTNWNKITVDATGKIETEDANDIAAAVGATRKITVKATPKTDYASAFSSTDAVSTELTVTIIEKTENIQVDFFWDAACTEANKITLSTAADPTSGTDNTYDNKVYVFNRGKFASGFGFPNGRIIYAKAKNEGDGIWFSYAQNADAAVIPANPTIDKKKRIYEYRRGIPIYIDDNLSGSDFVTINIVATTYDANTKKNNLRGTVARLKFPAIASHARPAQPTYDPLSPDADASLNKDGRKIMNTAENVVAYGKGASKTKPEGDGTLVYGKFSTGTVYTTEMLINEKAVQQGIGSVPVVSTEVAKRRFTSVQIEHYNDTGTYGEADYISEQTYTEYWYLYDTDLRLYSDAKKTTAYEDQKINLSTKRSSDQPYYKVMWYNKRNYDDPSNYNLGEAQEVDDYAGKIKYEITDNGGLTVGDEGDVKIDASTGVVTSLTNKEGRIKVTATYLGGEQHGGKSGEPQYTSTTDESTADFYVYIYDATKEVPTIKPQSRNFTGMMTYTITAPENWDVVYTTDGNDPVVPGTGVTPETNYIVHNSSVSKKIGESTATITVDFSMSNGATHTVKAIAYNPSNRSLYSVIVSEAYTKKAPIPSPTFDPSGVAEPYKYNTNELTVQIACAYPNAVIYYTTDGTDPVIGASNTYKYSGLSKVVISGNVTITAVAYDPVQQIYSPIVPSRYVYSSVMNKPYFQISKDGGNTWLGLETEGANSLTANGKKWYSGESFEITPSTQIRIVDPNPVTGTIFYTTNGDVPADNATTLIYSEGYPFTVGKTTIGQAITILEDAQSPVSTAEFIITGTNSNVWEAVEQTTTVGTPYNLTKTKRGIYAADGFTITTKKDLVVSSKESNDDNVGYSVNTNSLSAEKGGPAGGIMYAQQYITATLGGKMPKDEGKTQKAGKEWFEMTIADAAIGAPIDAVGKYSLKNNDDSRSENGERFMHAYLYRTDGKTAEQTPTASQKTFRLPTQGSFVRFEPERDGDLTIWVLQQGALLYEDDTYFIDNVLRLRPVYLVDEQGQSQKVKVVNNVPQMWSSARLSENWTKIQATAASNGWIDHNAVQYLCKTTASGYSVGTLTKTEPAGKEGTDYKKMTNNGPGTTQTATLYQMYKADLDKNYVSVGDPIKPFAIHTGQTISVDNSNGTFIDNSDDGTGYVLASGGYAKYTFEVKAGKTYYFLAQGSKIGLRGFQFIPASTTEENITLDDNGATSNMSAINNANAENIQNVTLNAGATARSFTANQWTTLLLPFSMSETQVSQTFGQNTRILHFSKIDMTEKKIHLGNHCYDMIVAGTPVLICPTKAATIEGVKTHIERTVSAESALDGDGMGDGKYTFNGSYSQAKIDQYDMFINNSGNFMQFGGSNNTAYKNCRAWIKGFTSTSEAKGLSLSIDGTDADENTTTAIMRILTGEDAENAWSGPAMIYNANGQLVRRNSTSLNGLPAGVYIIKSADAPNGRKVTVK